TPTFSGTTPAILPISVEPRALSGGPYSTAITLRFPDGSITVPVTVSLSASPILVTSPGALVFDTSSVAIPSQGFVAAVSNGVTTSTSASTTTPWLRVEGANSFVVTVDRMKAGTSLSSGAVQVHSSPLRPVVNDPWNVPVIYLGSGLGSRGPLSFTPSVLTF